MQLDRKEQKSLAVLAFWRACICPSPQPTDVCGYVTADSSPQARLLRGLRTGHRAQHHCAQDHRGQHHRPALHLAPLRPGPPPSAPLSLAPRPAPPQCLPATMFCCDAGPTQWWYQCSDLDLVPDLEGGRGQLFMALSVQGAVQGCVCEAVSGKSTRNIQGKGLWQGGLLGLGTNVVCRARLGSGPGQAGIRGERTHRCREKPLHRVLGCCWHLGDGEQFPGGRTHPVGD